MTRTLVTTAVLFLLCVLAACQHQPIVAPAAPATAPVEVTSVTDTDCSVKPPNEQFVSSVGRAMGGLPLAAHVKDGQHVGARIMLELKVSNITYEPWGYMVFDYLRPEHRFALWVVHDGRQIVLSDYGKGVSPRKDGGWAGGGPMLPLQTGESKMMRIDLPLLFQMTEPGSYTVVVEEGPLSEVSHNPYRESNCAKTTFSLLPIAGK